MKSLKTEEVNGVLIVKEIQKRPVDPQATRKGPAADLIKALPEFNQMAIKASKGANHTRAGFLEKRKAEEFRKVDNIAQADIHSEKAKKQFGAADLINDEILKIRDEFVPKQKQILQDNIIYCEPRLGEVIKTEAEIVAIEEVLLNRAPNTQIKTDGSVVDDFRGVAYNKKTSGNWSKVVIDKIGVKMPTGGKLDENLTDTDKAEIEAGRVALLSVEDKTTERTTAINGAMEKTIKMKSELEIKADPDALTKSQTFYNGEVAKIESKYL